VDKLIENMASSNIKELFKSLINSGIDMPKSCLDRMSEIARHESRVLRGGNYSTPLSVFVDGVEVLEVTVVDPVERTYTRAILDASGKPFVLGDEVASETCTTDNLLVMHNGQDIVNKYSWGDYAINC
tara:strand:+ start:210 stop:593 length:384 start_codon:yes stop_codon:yes gene_type:complete